MCSPLGHIDCRYASLVSDSVAFGLQYVHEYYVTTPSTMTFRDCRPGERFLAFSCVPCVEGSYLFEYSRETEVCASCPEEAESCHDNVITLKEGYWRRTMNSEVIFACDSQGCIGGNGTGDNLCAEGYEDIMCSVCADGYYWSGDSLTCEICSGSNLFSASFTVFLVFLVAVASGVLVHFYYKFFADNSFGQQDKSFDQQAKIPTSATLALVVESMSWLKKLYSNRIKMVSLYLKLIASTFQIVCSSSNTFQLTYPASLSSFFAIFKLLNLNVTSILPFSCSHRMDFVENLLVTTLAPIFLLLVLSSFLVGQILYYRWQISSGNSENKDEEIRDQTKRLKFQYFNVFLILSFLVLPSITTTIFQMFPCKNVDPGNEDDMPNTYLQADFTIDCESPRYQTGVGIAVAMIFIYPLGIPAFYLYSLYKKKNEIINRKALEVGGKLPDGLVVLEFLFRAYKPELWYFEVVETYRRLCMTAILSVIATGSSSQVVCAMLLSCFFLKAYDKVKPYEKENVAILAEVGQAQIFFSFFGALIIRGNLLGSDANALVGGTLIPINLSVILVAVYFELNKTAGKTSFQTQEVSENDTENPLRKSVKPEFELTELKKDASDESTIEVLKKEQRVEQLEREKEMYLHQLQEKDELIQEKDELIQEKDELIQEKDRQLEREKEMYLHQLQEKDELIQEKEGQVEREKMFVCQVNFF